MKKGFTLIELLAIIIILGIIAVITVPIINRSITNAKDNLYEEQVSQIQSAAKKWGSNEMEILDSSPGNVYFLSISELQNSGYLESSDILDPRNKEKMDGCVVVKYDKEYNQYTYKYNSNSCEAAKTNIVYNNGTTIYFNPETGKICTDYKEDNSLNENKTGCMKWYIFNDKSNSTKINMILDHNTTYNTLWNSTGDGTKGPKEILDKLKSDTSLWDGIVNRSDSYNANAYEVNYSGFKARLITANELAQITQADKILNWNENLSTLQYYLDGADGTDSNWASAVATSKGMSKYSWLYDYTYDCEISGCNIADSNTYGYFTSTVVYKKNNSAWRVGRLGFVGARDIDKLSYGVRPVITIDKSLIY